MITNEVVNKAIDYIMQHINENISIEDVAEYCHFSKYHFSRLFKAETGESLYAYIKRVRLEQSAFRLKVERGKTITDIGYEYGYTPSNYSSAFKQLHNETPADFRKKIVKESVDHPFFHIAEKELETLEECKKKVTIEVLSDYEVIYERRKGNYHEMGRVWAEFMEKYEGYRTDETLMFERTFDDPSITNVDGCLYDICMTAPKNCKLENITTLQGGKFAVYHFAGPSKEIYAAYQSFFNVWFPQSHYEVDERYGFDVYREINCDPDFLIIDFCFPVK